MSGDQEIRLISVKVKYVAPEDRLALVGLDSAGQRLPLMLTRRLTQRLINALSDLLERTQPLEDKAGLITRGDLYTLEQSKALQELREKPQAPSTPAAGNRLPAQLIQHVDLSVNQAGTRLTFRGPGARTCVLVADRHATHGLIDLLRRKSMEAEWRLEISSLVPPQEILGRLN
jgi:hypothetical protein